MKSNLRAFFTLFVCFCTTFLFAGAVAAKQLTAAEATAMSPKERTIALLQQPQVDDVYAARLDHFAQEDWGDPDPDWGQLRVIEVTPTTIVVVAEETAWYEAEEAVDALRGDLSDVESWVYDEEITIKRSELESLRQQGLILEARRFTPAEVRRYLDK